MATTTLTDKMAMMIIYIALTLSSSALAEKNPYSRGTGKKVAGILLTAIGPSLGAIIYLGAAMHTCDSDENESECDQGTKRARQMKYAALGLAAGTAAPGILLIISGTRDKKRWQNWEDEQEGRDAKAHSLRLSPFVGAKVRGLMLSMDL